MSTLFTDVAQLFARRQQKKTEDFDSLVTSIMAGGRKAPKPEDIAETLDAAGKTPDDLATEVGRRQERIDDARKLAEVPKLQSQWTELQQAGEKERARMFPLIQEHEEAIRKINAQLYFLEAEIADAQGRRQKLTASYRGSLQAALVENRAQQNELGRSIAAAEKNAADHQRFATIDNLIGSGGRPSHYDPASVKWRGEAASACQAQAEELRKQLDPLIKREAAIAEEMLIP